jgi:hypothetical protein
MPVVDIAAHPMTQTVVIQSYRTDNVPEWIDMCQASVRGWAAVRGWDYQFVGDEILDLVPDWYQQRAQGRMPVITDLGRLILAREALQAGASAAIWVDADVMIFDAHRFMVDIALDYAFCREIWVQPGSGSGLKIYRNVHNAVCLFRQANPMLDFYIHACKSVMKRVQTGAASGVPNQIVGTKLLTAMHNIVGFPLLDDVGMASPLVLRDLAAGGGAALDRLQTESASPLKAANLCGSLVGQTVDGVEISQDLMVRVCEALAAGEII